MLRENQKNFTVFYKKNSLIHDFYRTNIIFFVAEKLFARSVYKYTPEESFEASNGIE